MRFLLYDRVTSLTKGESITGIKTFSLADEFLRRHFHRAPMVPPSMLVEAMVQLLGWSVIHAHDFQLAAIVCLVEDVSIISPRLCPGFAAELGGEILTSGSEDSLGKAWLDVAGTRIATIDRIIFRHFRPVVADELKRTFNYCAGQLIVVDDGLSSS